MRFFILLIITLCAALVFANPHANMRLRSYVRMEDQVLQLNQEISEMRDKLRSGSSDIALDRQIEARERRLESLNTFLNRQRESLSSAGISLDTIDRDMLRHEIRQQERDMASHRIMTGTDGIPEIHRPHLDHRNFDPEKMRKEHLERMERHRSERIPGVSHAMGTGDSIHRDINSRSFNVPGRPNSISNHDEEMFKSLMRNLGPDKTRELVQKYLEEEGNGSL